MEVATQQLVNNKSRTQKFFRISTPSDQLLKDIKTAMPKEQSLAIIMPEEKELQEILGRFSLKRSPVRAYRHIAAVAPHDDGEEKKYSKRKSSRRL